MGWMAAAHMERMSDQTPIKFDVNSLLYSLEALELAPEFKV